MEEAEKKGTRRALRLLLDPRETTIQQFTEFFIRAICLVLLAGFAILVCILLPMSWVSEVWYRVLAALWPVVLQ